MASIALRLPEEELTAIEVARGSTKRLTWIRQVLRDACEAEPVPAAKPARNAPCPCGSGRKSKKCCYA